VNLKAPLPQANP